MNHQIKQRELESSVVAPRRALIKAGLGLMALASGSSRAAEWSPSLRYPDPAVAVLDESFLKYRLFSASVERLATGMRWAEGPVWVGDGRYLLLSDVANDRIMRWDEATGQFTVFRSPSNFSNGLARDLHGRLLACEGSSSVLGGAGRRVTRTETNGRVTVLADSYDGKPLNSPNDLAVRSDGSIWFTDPPFQLSNNYEGRVAKQEQPHGVYRVDGLTGKLTRVLENVAGPNGLCFSPDEKKLYVVEGRVAPNRLVWAYDVNPDGTLGDRTKVVEALNHGALDGIRCDVDGNLWCGWGSTGALSGQPEALDGVMVFSPQGKAIGHIRLPERCGNLCFGGAEGNRLFMASSHSLYAIYVNTRGAAWR